MRLKDESPQSQGDSSVDNSVDKEKSRTDLVNQIEDQDLRARTLLSRTIENTRCCVDLDIFLESFGILIIEKLERCLPELAPAMISYKELQDKRYEDTKAMGDMVAHDALTMRDDLENS